MPVTRERTKIKQDGQLRNYISYFQSVTTIALINPARSLQEAEDKAKRKFSSSDLSCGIVAQTPFEISETETWCPDFAGCYLPIDNSSGKMSFDLNGVTKQRIAEKLQKSVEDVTEEDCVLFVKEAVESCLV